MDDIKKMFWDSVSGAIDAEGVYPHQMIMIDKDDKIVFSMLDYDFRGVLVHTLKAIHVQNCKELIFGIDRSTKEGQGTEFADVLTCAHWKDGVWTIGVINYQNEPRIVRDWDWDNEFWKAQMLHEIKSMEDLAEGLKKKLESMGKDYSASRPDLDPAKLAEWEGHYNKWVKETNGVEDVRVKEICLAGDWLGDELRKMDVGEELIQRICFVCGQRSFMGNPWEVAERVLNDYENGKIEEPGEELAEKINDELLSSFTTPVSEV